MLTVTSVCVPKKMKVYLFETSADLVNKIVSKLYNAYNFQCVTFSWIQLCMSILLFQLWCSHEIVIY